MIVKTVFVVLPFLLTGCGLVPIPHVLKMPSNATVVLRDRDTDLSINQAEVYYIAHKYENWFKPFEYEWEVTDDCFTTGNYSHNNNKNTWQAQNRSYGLYQFPQKSKIGWSKFWGIGPLGSWLYDTYQGYYYICSPGYHGINFSDNVHSNRAWVSEFISFEKDKVVVYLVPIAEDIPIGQQSYRDK